MFNTVAWEQRRRMVFVLFSPDNKDSNTIAEQSIEAEQSKEETQRLICSALNSEHLKSYQLTKVAECGGAAPGGGVAVINTSHHEQLFGHRR